MPRRFEPLPLPGEEISEERPYTPHATSEFRAEPPPFVNLERLADQLVTILYGKEGDPRGSIFDILNSVPPGAELVSLAGLARKLPGAFRGVPRSRAVERYTGLVAPPNEVEQLLARIRKVMATKRPAKPIVVTPPSGGELAQTSAEDAQAWREWRQMLKGPAPTPRRGELTMEEALEVLGTPSPRSMGLWSVPPSGRSAILRMLKEQARRRHRELSAKMHPDINPSAPIEAWDMVQKAKDVVDRLLTEEAIARGGPRVGKQ